jgi:hypothetical protein
MGQEDARRGALGTLNPVFQTKIKKLYELGSQLPYL